MLHFFFYQEPYMKQNTIKTFTFIFRYGEIGYKYNSGRKLAQNVSKTGPKFATSSAKKKVVMNSTSEAENVVPTDWDASAIVPPGQVQSNKGKSQFM